MTTDNTEQGVAEATDVAVPEGNANGQDTQVQQTDTASAEPQSEKEVELARQLADAEQRYKSAEGRLKAKDDSSPSVLQPHIDALQAATTEIKRERRDRRKRDLADADIPLNERQAALGQIEVEEKAEADQARLYAYSDKLAKRINSRLERAGLATDHPKVQEALEKWSAATSEDEFDDVFDAVDDLLADEREVQTKTAVESAQKELEETRQRFNQENGTLDVGANSAGVGQSGNMSDQSTFEAYGRGEIPWSKRVADAGKNLGYLP